MGTIAMGICGGEADCPVIENQVEVKRGLLQRSKGTCTFPCLVPSPHKTYSRDPQGPKAKKNKKIIYVFFKGIMRQSWVESLVVLYQDGLLVFYPPSGEASAPETGIRPEMIIPGLYGSRMLE